MRATFALLALLIAVIGDTTFARAQTSQEAVKAIFLYRFASFVTWPQATFADESSTVRLCVIGADPLAASLQRATANQRLGERAFDVRRIDGADDIAGCHVLYVVGDRTSAVLRAARHAPILTITDGVSGGERGIIHFTVVDARVRFYIDDARASESRLAIDPRLLSLALSVRRRSAS